MRERISQPQASFSGSGFILAWRHHSELEEHLAMSQKTQVLVPINVTDPLV